MPARDTCMYVCMELRIKGEVVQGAELEQSFVFH
jgi:hypothetical protein